MAAPAPHSPTWQLRRTAEIVRAGGIIAYPTEAVFGLGCDPFNPQAVVNLLELKQRSVDKGVILIAADFDQLTPFLGKLNTTMLKKVSRTYAEPTTWLVPKADDLPYWLSGKHDRIAVRITAHPLAAELCRQCHHALVSTSANLSGQPPAKNSLSVQRRLGNQVDKIVHGGTLGFAKPSRIIDAVSNKTIRAN